VKIGTWLLDGRQCSLVGRTDWWDGKGHGRLPTSEDPYAKIEVALRGDWAECMDAVLHEVLELVICAHNWEWSAPLAAMHSDSGTRLIVMTHEQYQEAVRIAADYLMMCLVPLEKAWCKCNKMKFSRG
jgi:hypothetical protein